jgi:hypothetical protein
MVLHRTDWIAHSFERRIPLALSRERELIIYAEWDDKLFAVFEEAEKAMTQLDHTRLG